MGIAGIGQSFDVQRAMLVILDGTGRAQGWEVRDGVGRWEFTGVAQDDGSSTATVTMTGKFKRRSKEIPPAMKELLQ